MSPEELESYNIQLEQVNLAISKDPENEELANLRSDLLQFIELTKSFLDSQALTAKKPSQPKKEQVKFEVGDHCLAKWSGDGGFYEAIISAKTEVGDDLMYSVIFVGYNDVGMFKLEDLKVYVPQVKRPEPEAPTEEISKKKKKRKPMERPTGPSKVEVEQKKKQDAWLKFANKKSKTKTAPINQKSIFSTPDNPNAKVGVIGSGNPMTQFAQREKHIFKK